MCLKEERMHVGSKSSGYIRMEIQIPRDYEEEQVQTTLDILRAGKVEETLLIRIDIV